VIDRFGKPSGRYASMPGATIAERGMPPGSQALEYHRYLTVRGIRDVQMGPAAAVPEFGASGGAFQFRFKLSLQEMLDKGYLKEQATAP